MVDQILLNDTLQKINASLNKRFEKDADLYISKQDEYEIKKNLCNGAYGGVMDMARAKGISHDILVKVIMRNASVLNVKNIHKFKKELKPILEDANYRTLSYMMEDVLSGNIYMQKKVRHVLFSYYMEGITAKARIEYWKRGDFDLTLDERKELFKIIIEKTNHKDSSKTLKFKLDFIQDAFKEYPDLMDMKVKAFDNLKVTLNTSEEMEFFRYLCEEMQKPSIHNEAYNFALTDAYVSYGEKAFNDAVSQIKASSPENYKQYIKAICQLLRGEKDKAVLIGMFDTLSKVYDSPYIKSHVKKEIEKKVWKTAEGNKALYEERKEKIDHFLSETKQTDKEKYNSFDDIMVDLLDDIKPKSIAYFWVNMKSPGFEKSILESFTRLDSDDLMSTNEIYRGLFEHSMAKGNVKELTRMCRRLVGPLNEFNSLNEESDYYDALDELWVDYVVKWKLQGKEIETYMFKKHFDRVREWEGRS